MIPSDVLNMVVNAIGATVLQSILPMLVLWCSIQVVVLAIPSKAKELRYWVLMSGLVCMTIPHAAILSQKIGRIGAMIGRSDAMQSFGMSTPQVPTIRSEMRVPSSSRSVPMPEVQTAGRATLLDARIPSEALRDNVPPARLHWQGWLNEAVPNTGAWVPAIGWLWLLGLLFTSIRLSIAVRAIRAWRRAPSSLCFELRNSFDRALKRMDFRRKVELLVSDRVMVPVAFGILRPVIVVPSSVVTGLTPAELEAVLSHEIAHLKRHDLWFNLIQVLIETIFFYHPCVWMLSRQIRQQREVCCDARAARSPSERISLGNALLKLESICSRRPVLAASACDGDTLRRVKSLCNVPSVGTSVPLWLVVAGSLCAACFVVGVSFPRRADAQLPVKNKESAAKVFKGIAGQIVDEKGNAIAGARVVFQKFEPRDDLATQSDDSGNFSISIDEDLTNRKFRHCRLWVFANGFNAKAVKPTASESGVNQCRVVLETRHSFIVRVLMPDGSPCPGALVEPYYFQLPNGVYDSDKPTGLSGPAPAEIRTMLGARTDAAGNAKINGAKAEFVVSIAIEVAGQAQQTKRAAFHKATVTTIQLAPTANVVGSFKGIDLAPLKDRMVYVSSKLFTQPNFNAPFRHDLALESTVMCSVNAEGTFEAKNIIAGEVEFTVLWDPQSPIQLKLPMNVKLSPGETRDVFFERVEGVKVRGQLLTDDTQEPVSKTRVAIRSSQDQIRFSGLNHVRHSVESNDNGEFEVYVPRGNIQIQAFDASEWPSVHKNAYGYPGLARKLVNLTVKEVVLEPMLFPRKKEVEISVVDKAGRPLADRTIACITDALGHSLATGTTDEQGIATVRYDSQGVPDQFRKGQKRCQEPFIDN